MRLKTVGWLLCVLGWLAAHAHIVQAKGKIWIQACNGSCTDDSGLYGLVAIADDESQTTDSHGKVCITLNDREPNERVDVTVDGGGSYKSRTLRGVTVVRECIGRPVSFRLDTTEQSKSERSQPEPQRSSNSFTVNAQNAYVIQSPRAPEWPRGSDRIARADRPASLMPWKILAYSVGGIVLAGAIVPLVLSENARSSFDNTAGCGTKLPDHGVSGCDELYNERHSNLTIAGVLGGVGAAAIVIGWLIPKHSGNLDVYQSSLHCAPYADAGLSCKLSL